MSQSYDEIILIFQAGNMRSSVGWMDEEADRLCYHLVCPALKGNKTHAVLMGLAEGRGIQGTGISVQGRGGDAQMNINFFYLFLSGLTSLTLVLFQSHYFLTPFFTQSTFSWLQYFFPQLSHCCSFPHSPSSLNFYSHFSPLPASSWSLSLDHLCAPHTSILIRQSLSSSVLLYH